MHPAFGHGVRMLAIDLVRHGVPGELLDSAVARVLSEPGLEQRIAQIKSDVAYHESLTCPLPVEREVIQEWCHL